MTQNLCQAVMTSIEALLQVPGTQLQHIESTLRQLLADLKAANITPPADLDMLIEDAAVAHFETMAHNDWAQPEEYDDYAWEKYEEGLIERAHQNPEAYKKLAQFLDNELPF